MRSIAHRAIPKMCAFLLLYLVWWPQPAKAGAHPPKTSHKHRRARHRKRTHKRKFRRRKQRRRRKRKKKRRIRRWQTPKCKYLLTQKGAFRYLRPKRRLETSFRRYIRSLRRCQHLSPSDKPRLLVYNHKRCTLVAMRHKYRTSAASLIKLYVMLGAYHKAKQSKVHLVHFPRDLQMAIDDMMQLSDNKATNYLIKQYLGGGKPKRGLRYLRKILRRYKYRRTRIVELIPRGGRTYRNSTTAQELNRILTKIYRKKLLSPAISKRMLKIMLDSRELRGKSPYLRDIHKIRAATKTGYTRRTNGVAGIFFGTPNARHAPYNLIAIITRPWRRHPKWRWRHTTKQILQRISEMTHRYHRLGYAKRERTNKRYKRLCKR